MDVLENPTRRKALLDEATLELKQLRVRYSELSELAKIFAEVDRLS